MFKYYSYLHQVCLQGGKTDTLANFLGRADRSWAVCEHVHPSWGCVPCTRSQGQAFFAAIATKFFPKDGVGLVPRRGCLLTLAY
jgi:hypothetical protein